MGVRYHLNNQEQLNNFIDFVDQARLAGKSICVEVIPQTKSSRQRNAMHLWLRQLAIALNDAGYDQTSFPWREGMEIPFTESSTKELFWRPVEQAMYGHDSTEQETGMECAEIHEVLVRALITKLPGFTPPDWPHVP